jgi:hypothetical protein
MLGVWNQQNTSPGVQAVLAGKLELAAGVGPEVKAEVSQFPKSGSFFPYLSEGK